ncbi:MAG: hypothetical protein LBC87_00565 [Fibromonadaceae bacterium]|nr:hypothetical protein [Fibromonadaceae bacterium]
MKKLPKITCFLIPFLLVSPLIAIIAVFLVFTKLNDIKTEKLANEILNGPIPNSTEVIEIISGCGNVTGTGNDVEIWIGLLVKSELSKEELLEFYRNLYGKNIEVYEASTYKYRNSLLMKMLKIEFNSLKNLSSYDNYFIIGRSEEAVSANFDLRGF